MLIYAVYSQYDLHNKCVIGGGYMEMRFSEHDGVFMNDDYVEFMIQEIPHRSRVWFRLCTDLSTDSTIYCMKSDVQGGIRGLCVNPGSWTFHLVTS